MFKNSKTTKQLSAEGRNMCYWQAISNLNMLILSYSFTQHRKCWLRRHVAETFPPYLWIFVKQFEMIILGSEVGWFWLGNTLMSQQYQTNKAALWRTFHLWTQLSMEDWRITNNLLDYYCVIFYDNSKKCWSKTDINETEEGSSPPFLYLKEEDKAHSFTRKDQKGGKNHSLGLTVLAAFTIP